MGQAEQRQVRTGVADRVKREQQIRDMQDRRLWEIGQRVRALDEHDRRRAGLERALRCDVGLAILNADPPSDEEVAAKARWSVADVERLRQDIKDADPK
ncbi:hypothetical protein [Patulibacter minatonensis]|uniref:hypothetical protein n=1 Tax=Patulibacter minatonensis TaxID=298163 RepID=UPI0004B9FF55|nr:hypothetical protein [Patulibacter minatonensis]